MKMEPRGIFIMVLLMSMYSLVFISAAPSGGDSQVHVDYDSFNDAKPQKNEGEGFANSYNEFKLLSLNSGSKAGGKGANGGDGSGEASTFFGLLSSARGTGRGQSRHNHDH